MTTTDDYRSIWTYLLDVAFTQGYVDAAGIRTRYIQAGPKDAPTLIMLHGLGGSWENMFGNVRAHAAHFNTIAFDLVGHGFSSKPDKILEIADYVAHLKNFMDALRIDRASFIGLSLGSWITTKFATLHPDRVNKVTMVSAWGRPRTEPAPVDSSGRPWGMSSRIEAVTNPTWKAMENIFAELIHFPKNRIPDLLGLRQAIYRQPEMKRSMENIWAGIAPDRWNKNALTDDEVKQVKCPYLIVAAVDHKDVFLESSYAYKKLIPNSKLIEMHGASHWAQWECVDEFNRANLEFLRGN
jgi:2-hydroxy-6-oxonona-2,4-dienedioate hydrolase